MKIFFKALFLVGSLASLSMSASLWSTAATINKLQVWVTVHPASVGVPAPTTCLVELTGGAQYFLELTGDMSSKEMFELLVQAKVNARPVQFWYDPGITLTANLIQGGSQTSKPQIFSVSLN